MVDSVRTEDEKKQKAKTENELLKRMRTGTILQRIEAGTIFVSTIIIIILLCLLPVKWACDKLGVFKSEDQRIYDDFGKDVINDLEPFNAELLSDFEEENIEKITVEETKGMSNEVSLLYYRVKLDFVNIGEQTFWIPLPTRKLDDGGYRSLKLFVIMDNNEEQINAYKNLLSAIIADAEAEYRKSGDSVNYKSLTHSTGLSTQTFLDYYLLRVYGIDILDENAELGYWLGSFIYNEGFDLVKSVSLYETFAESFWESIFG